LKIEVLKNFIKSKYEFLILIAIIIASFIFQLSLFLVCPYSYGVDGAYYDINVINILETGVMWSDDNPFVFYYFTLWALILGDVTLAIKVGIVSLCSLIPVPVYLIVKKFSKNGAAALFGAFISTFNPLLFRMMGDFVKNAAGVLFLLCFIYIFINTCEKDYNFKKKVLYYTISYLIFILIMFTHIYPTGFAVCVVAIYFIYSIIYSLITDRKFSWKDTKFILFLVISVGITFIIGYLIVPDYFDQFSKIYSFINNLLESVIIHNNRILESIYLGSIKKPPPPMETEILPLPIFIILLLITCTGAIIIIIDIIRRKKFRKEIQYIAFFLLIYFPVYLLVPYISHYPIGFFYEPNPMIDLLTFLTTFPVSLGVALICFEIYKNDKNQKIINRIKGTLIAIFLMSFALSLPFIPMEWRSRFVFMNFVPISLFIGYAIKKLNVGKKKIAAAIIIGFFSISMVIQTQNFCTYAFRPVLTEAGEKDLLYLKNYVNTNSSLSGSIVIIEDLGIYYFTILITGLDCKKSGDPDEVAKEYNETVFIVVPKFGPPPPLEPGDIIIRNVPDGQLIIILANYTYHD